ncbi:MAG: hypothetical protein ACRDQA_04290 [Nocardioidaceae bacterium]
MAYADMYAHLYPLIKSVNPNVLLIPISAGYAWSNAQPFGDPIPIQPAPSTVDGYSIDVYYRKNDYDPNTQSFPLLIEASSDLGNWFPWASRQGRDLHHTEWAVPYIWDDHPNAPDDVRANAIAAQGQWFIDKGYASAHYWDCDSGKGGAGGTAHWYVDDDPPAKQAMRDLSAKGTYGLTPPNDPPEDGPHMTITLTGTETYGWGPRARAHQVPLPIYGADDLLVLVFACRNVTSIAPESGWTVQASYTVGGDDSEICVATRLPPATGETTVEVVVSEASGRNASAVTLAYSGADQNTPVDTAATLRYHSNGTDPTAPSLVTQTADALVLALYAVYGVIDAGPGGYTEIVLHPATVAVGTYSRTMTSPGATGDAVASSTANQTTGVQLALRPAAATPSEGTATGTFTWSGSATGSTAHSGSTSGGVTWAGSASGSTAHDGTTSGIITWSGTATGSTKHTGTATGSIAWSGTATGHAPAVGAHSGTAAGTIVWTGATSGSTSHAGTTAGTLTWTGTASGHTPAVAMHSGTASGTLTWTGTAHGHATKPARNINLTDTAPIGHWSDTPNDGHWTDGGPGGHWTDTPPETHWSDTPVGANP